MSADLAARPHPADEPPLALVDPIHRFAGATIDAGDIDRRGVIPRVVLDELAAMGIFGATIPETHGGSGLGLSGACEIVGALAEHDRSVATTVGLHLGLGTRGLVRWGSAGLRERLLPDLASGARIAAFAATEPGAGSDLRAIATRAIADGSGVTVDGAKIFVTNGGFASVYTLLVRAPDAAGRGGQRLLVLERDDPGVVVGPEEQKLGLRGSSTTSLHLDGVRVGADRFLDGDGADRVAHVLAWGRTVMAAGCVGAARTALRRAARHVSTRRQFGRTLDALPVVREQVADMAAELFAMQAIVRRAASTEELATLSLVAKIACSEGACRLADQAIQLHGGSGFVEETGLPLLLRDARITRIFEGANDVLLGHLGSLYAIRPPPRDPPIGRFADRADALRRAVDVVRDDLVGEHGVQLVRRPRDLHRLGQLVVLAELADAAASAGERDLAAGELAEHFLELARRRIGPLLDAPPPIDRLTSITTRCVEGVLP